MEALNHERTKYDIPLSHLDYGYIEKCKDVKELEKIVKVLRQGHEGRYPQLEQRAEECLAKLSPNSRVLRKDKPIGKLSDLEKDERQKLTEDLDSWMTSMKHQEEVWNTERSDVINSTNLPPVRGAGTTKIKSSTNQSKSENKENKSKKRVKPRDYREWDKVDIDAELAKVDGDKKPENKDKDKTQSNVLKNPSTPNIPDSVDVLGLTEGEKMVKAEREKDKGNEAFRSGDYQEAVLYYSRSINLIPTVPAQNNRAQSYIKLKQWDKAITDCNSVLKTEEKNLKAMLRRGVAFQGKKEFIKAAKDITFVLDMEPNNKRASDILNEIEKSLEEQKKRGRRMVIEEVEGSDSEDSDSLSNVEVADNIDTQPGINGRDDEAIRQRVLNLTQGKSAGEGAKIVEITEEEEKGKIPPVKKAPSPAKSTQPKEVKTTKAATPEVPSNVEKNDSKKAAVPEPAKPEPEVPKEVEVVQLELPKAVATLKDSGNGLFRTGQYADAIEVYDKAITNLPDEAGHATNKSVLYSNRAACKSKIGDCEGCVKDCNLAMELVPGSIKPMMRRAQAYETMEKYRKAYVDYRQVLMLDPSVEMASQGASRCSQILQQQDGVRWRQRLPPMKPVASPSMFKAPQQPTSSTPAQPTPVQPSPPSQDPQPAKAARPGKKEAEKASSDNSSSHKGEPEVTMTELFAQFKAEGNDLVKKGQYEGAIKAYSKCTECCPDEVASYTNRALCYLKLNRPAEVIDDCDTAITLDPDNIKALFRRAQAHKMLSNYDESIQDLRRLLSLDRNNTAAKKDFETVLRLKQQQMQAKKAKESQPKPAPPKPQEKVRQRMKIEEIESSSEDEEKTVTKPPPPTKKIEEVKSLEPQTQQSKKSKKKKGKGAKQQTAAATTAAGQKPAENGSAGFSTGFSKAKSSSSKIKATAMDYSTAKDAPILNKSSPYEFMHAWMSLKGSESIDLYCKVLEQIKPEELITVISNKLEGDMLITLAKCADILVERGEVDRGFSYLQHLTRVPRFQVLAMFLSDKEKKDIVLVFDRLQAKGTICPNALVKLKKEYGL